MMSVDGLGKRMQSLRESQDITQTAMAEKLNISRSALYRYETGERLPDVEVLANFARFFNITIDSLVFGAVEKATGSSLSNENKQATPQPTLEDSLLEIFHKHGLGDTQKVSDEQLALIDRLIQAVLDSSLD